VRAAAFAERIRDIQVYFHIGLHKTATTWLQRHLFPALPGVTCMVTRRLGGVAEPRDGSTLIVSHEALSGTLSSEKQPGDNKKRLTETLSSVAEVAPGAPIIIGFREHRSWLTAAYAQKAKKQGVKAERYLATFSRDDLSWCRSLDLIEEGKRPVFAFLYEELSQGPEALIGDLCRFLRTQTPANLTEILSVRENASPRSQAGQLLSRPFFQVSYALERFTPIKARPLRELGARLGTQLDQNFTPLQIELEPDMAGELRRDWDSLLKRMSDIRGRDLSAMAQTAQADQVPA
jgi:hypothetical protein